MSIPQIGPRTEVPEVPTKDQLVAQLTQLMVQRSQLKDQIDVIERQLPTVQSLIQLLTAQEVIAAAAKAPEVIED